MKAEVVIAESFLPFSVAVGDEVEVLELKDECKAVIQIDGWMTEVGYKAGCGGRDIALPKVKILEDYTLHTSLIGKSVGLECDIVGGDIDTYYISHPSFPQNQIISQRHVELI